MDIQCEGRSDLPHQVLESLQLADKRWLEIFIQIAGLNPEGLENAMNSVIFEMKEKGIIWKLKDGLLYLAKQMTVFRYYWKCTMKTQKISKVQNNSGPLTLVLPLVGLD